MSKTIVASGDNAAPTASESRVAAESSRRLAEMVSKRNRKNIELRIGHDEIPIAVPASCLRLLSEALAEMAKGNAVKLLTFTPELTTREAAELLNVSRPFLIEQLNKGMMPFRMVGTHRRILLRDVMAYKQRIDRDRIQALEELSAIDQRHGLGY